MASLFLILCQSSIAQIVEQYPNWGWPVKTDGLNNHRGTMVGTPGEYRSPYSGAGSIFGDPYPANQDRFHRGVDLIGDDGAAGNVYSIEPGTHLIQMESSGYNRRMLVDNTIYWHINEANGLVSNVSMVAENELIATMNSTAAHLHIQTPGTNYLINRLPRYYDCVNPQINAYSFRENGHSLDNNADILNSTQIVNDTIRTILYNKIDMVINSTDQRTMANCEGGGGNLAPNQLFYNVYDRNGSMVVDTALWVDFTSLPSQEAADEVFGYGSDCCTNVVFNYIITSHPSTQPYDRYWNTRLKGNLASNEENDWTENIAFDASINREAKYKDDLYVVLMTIRDIDSFGTDSMNVGRDTARVLIDNFRPHIDSISIYNIDNLAGDSVEVYGAHWVWDPGFDNGGGATPGRLSLSQNNITDASGNRGDLSVHAFTSEPMDFASLALGGNSYAPQTGATGRHLHFTVPADDIGELLDTNSLHFIGADLAGNPLLGFTDQAPGPNAHAADELPHRTGADSNRHILAEQPNFFEKNHQNIYETVSFALTLNHIF